MEVKDQVRQFIISNYYVPDAEEIGDQTSLLMGGIIDSTGVLELVKFLEDTFGIKVEDQELLPENFDSLGQIESYLNRKRSKS